MSKVKNMTGQSLGRLNVLGLAHINHRGLVYWKCLCSCGVETTVSGANLRSGQVVSCGCLRIERSNKTCTKNLAGRRFGRLVVLRRVGSLGRLATWLCRCDCGGEVVATGTAVSRGRKISCGCASRDKLGEMPAELRRVSALRSSTRRARERGAPGKVTQADIEAILQRQRGRCVWCRSRLGDRYHRDHRIALSRGGSNGPENIDLLCQPCNLSKSNRAPEDWARTKGLLL